MQADDILLRPAVAIVILSWNGRKFLETYLPSVVRLQYQPMEIYVADNASSDDSIAYVREHFPTVKIISIPKNEGFAKGYNVALKQVVADYYFLVNQDVELSEDCLEPLIERMQSNDMIAACQPRIRAAWDRSQFEHAGAAGGYIDAIGYPFCRGRLFNVEEKDTEQYADAREIFWASGAAMLIRADLFNRFKGFDGDFFAHMEEIDLCWRLKRAGYQIWYVPESIVYHVGGGSLPKENPYKIYLNFRNNLSMMFKNYESADLIWRFPLRILLDNVAFLHAVLNGRWKEAGAIFRADWHFAISLPYQLKKRFDTWRQYHRNRVAVSRVKMSGYYSRSIVWQFFAKGKKRFSDLP